MHEYFWRSGWFLSGHQLNMWILPVSIVVILIVIALFISKANSKSEKK